MTAALSAVLSVPLPASVVAGAGVGLAGWLTRPNAAARRAEHVARLWRPSGAAGRAAPARSRPAGGRRAGGRAANRPAMELLAVVDIVMVAVSSGLSILAALRLAARSGPPEIGARLGALLADGSRPLADALDEFGRSCGPRAGSFVDVLASSIRYGIPVAPALERIQRELREETRRRLDTRIRRLPVLMLFPLVFCVLPALGLVGVVPVLVAAFRV
ncbi:MAG TPA: hypothetical protein DEP66_06195 [Acidimicrobiaceae bacterium]|nr:hypothetical protein [Acidimicrobiaceae bacterium]HCB37780.1 hypothetical protein [Acidimicrobiaceae bacterium]